MCAELGTSGVNMHKDCYMAFSRLFTVYIETISVGHVTAGKKW